MKLYKKDFTQEKYNELYEYCNAHNSYIEDKGEYYETVEIEVYVPTLEELKQKKLVLLEKNIEHAFYSVYPLHKQNNIGIFGTDEEREQFKVFHTTLVTEYDNRVLAVNNATSKEELDLIKIDFGDVLKNMLC